MAEILNTDQLKSLGKYQNLRDKTRNAVQYGMYPNCVAALKAWEELAIAISPGGELEEWGATHAETTAAVTPYIEMLIQNAGAIVQIVEAIASADPDAFPAVTPPVEEEEIETPLEPSPVQP